VQHAGQSVEAGERTGDEQHDADIPGLLRERGGQHQYLLPVGLFPGDDGLTVLLLRGRGGRCFQFRVSVPVFHIRPCRGLWGYRGLPIYVKIKCVHYRIRCVLLDQAIGYDTWMDEINRTHLFGKLNAQLFRAAESATVACKLRGNAYVELAHWMQQIIAEQDSDLRCIARHYGLDMAALEREITSELDRLPRGATSISDFSAHIDHAIERAWVYATLLYGQVVIRSGYLLVGMVKTPSLRQVLLRMSAQFAKLRPDVLAEELPGIIEGSPEARMGTHDGTPAQPGEASQALATARDGTPGALEKYALNLTERARQGQLDAVTGRDGEIRQIMDILLRRRQNNPLLTGEAGVGKTAVVEGLACRVAAGDVPPALRQIAIHALDLGLLQAGASMKGEFEQRLRQVIDEVQASSGQVVLFIDEIHTLIGAGGAAGTGDAANLLKPALARGLVRTIGATTWAEYKQYIEKDPALTRRFQAIQIDEPDEDKAIAMLRSISAQMHEHHRVLILDEAIAAAVRLSQRYIAARQLPDKAVSLLDTACARVALSQHATPPAVEAIEREMALLQMELDGVQDIGAHLRAHEAELAQARQRWQREHALVQRIFALRGQLHAGAAPGALSAVPEPLAAVQDAPEVSEVAAEPLDEQARAACVQQLQAAQAELDAVQANAPLVQPSVDAQAVATVVSEWTGIPVTRMVKDEIAAVLALADTLERRVVGQRHSLHLIAERIQTARARMEDASKPIGVFLLAGPSGVGKTETALALAEALYANERQLITVNMSEFQEAHTVSTLKGAPPGYVGYGQGGVLTEAVRRKPYSVVLLDEIEKAHRDVHELFFQVFDRGQMEDGEGRSIDFKNTVILLTSNVGSELMAQMCAEPERMPDPQALAQALRTPLLEVFPAAFLGRLTVVPYLPLSSTMLAAIVEIKLKRIEQRMQANHQARFVWDQAGIDAVMELARAAQAGESGARMADAILSNHVLSPISREILQRTMHGAALNRVNMSGRGQEIALEFA